MDMEEGVVSELLRSPLSEVFDHRQLITDVSGSGNNWCVCGVTSWENSVIYLLLQTGRSGTKCMESGMQRR